MNFERLDWKQLSVFCDVLSTTPSFQRNVIEGKFNSESLYFDETLNFLTTLELVIDNGENILPSDEFRKILSRPPDDIKDFFLHKLFNKPNPVTGYLADFLNSFEPHEGNFVFTPNTEQRLKYSGIRNLLIEFGAISSITPEGSYVASDKLSTYFLDRKKLLHYTEFEGRLRASEELGRKAEILILEKEKERFNDYPDLLSKIQHISLLDVSAGYDIKSFEKMPEKDGEWQPKYIEVKAVSESDLRFYWSKNEINKAKQFGRNYYLYLLPVKSESLLDISALRQIRDPYRAVFQNKGEWLQEIEVTSFYKK